MMTCLHNTFIRLFFIFGNCQLAMDKDQFFFVAGKTKHTAQLHTMSAVDGTPLVPPVNLSSLSTGEEYENSPIQSPTTQNNNHRNSPNHHQQSPQRKRQIKQLKKQPAIRLHVHILDKSFAMNVGRGTQDLKWLATVAAQRFDRMTKAHGRVRQRETMRAFRNVRVVLPAEVRTPRGSPRPGEKDPHKDGKSGKGDKGDQDDDDNGGWPYDFVHPKTRIRDVLRTGDHVEIAVDLDRDTRGCAPALQKEKAWQRVEDSGFQEYAFRNSKTSLENRLKHEKQIRERAARLREAQTVLRREIANQLFGADVNTSPEEVQKAFEEELKEMSMPMFIRGAKQRTLINELLREGYEDICLTFRFYGGLGSKADVIENATKDLYKKVGNKEEEEDNDDTISFNEFHQFVKQSRIYGGSGDGGSKITLATIKEIFRVVNSKMETGSSGSSAKFRVRGDGEFDRSEFMEALVHLARYKYPKQFDNDGAMQLRALFKEYIYVHAKHLVPNEFRAQLANSESANLVLDNLEVFRFIFDRYVDVKTNTMDRNTFLKLMYEIDMMVPVEKKGTRVIELIQDADTGALTIEQVDLLLAETQNEPAEEEKGSSRGGGRSGGGGGSALNTERSTLTELEAEQQVGLTFVSFIEAVARAGNERWQFEADDLDHRIETTIQQLRRLQFEKTNRRYLPQGAASET